MKKNYEKELESAYWEFDARRSGYGDWKTRPQSERDAFKQQLKKFFPEVPEVSKNKFFGLGFGLGISFCLVGLAILHSI